MPYQTLLQMNSMTISTTTIIPIIDIGMTLCDCAQLFIRYGWDDNYYDDNISPSSLYDSLSHTGVMIVVTNFLNN
jgi:hypothetical protein